jgi:hypothetical protein
MTVLLNKWDGQQFKNNIKCDLCDNKTTVISLNDPYDSPPYTCKIFICKGCLLAMVAEIDQAILSGITELCRGRSIAVIN